MPWFRDIHPDIVATGNIVLAACFMATFPDPRVGSVSTHFVEAVYMFETSGSIDFEPHFYIDITDVIETKKEALRQHKDLAKLFEGEDIEEVVRSVVAGDMARGVKSGVGYAEAFRRWTYPHGPSIAFTRLPEK
jgi:LmbE family N-acetylglucosaminyl deacetylase